MIFLRSMLFIGEGRLSGAVEREGKIDFFIDFDGAIIKKSIHRGRRGVAGNEPVSYADDYTETRNLAFSLVGNEIETRLL